jgi:stearoyl-CoA desaturase (delta-9 desaturase)
VRSPDIDSPSLPAASAAGPEAPATSRPIRIPNWLKSLPFLTVHALCLAVIWTGIDLTAAILCLVLYLVRMFAITAGYHRYFAHRSYRTSRGFRFFLGFLGCTAMQKGPLWWAAHHRLHHRYSDTEQDPHSPHRGGLFWSHLGWILAPDCNETPWSVIRDWRQYPELVWLNRLHWVPPILLGVLCWLIGGWSGLIVGLFCSTVLVYHATFTVNSLCHVFGTRRYETSDHSRNNWLVAILTLGEGWHNNHHHYQSAARQGFVWWEVDLSYYTLRLLEVFGVVWDIREPPRRLLRHKVVPPAC